MAPIFCDAYGRGLSSLSMRRKRYIVRHLSPGSPRALGHIPSQLRIATGASERSSESYWIIKNTHCFYFSLTNSLYPENTVSLCNMMQNGSGGSYSLSELKTRTMEQSYATVPFPVSKLQFQELIDTFVSFLALPFAVKQGLYFQVFPGDRGSEVGYKRYRREEGKTDNREYVHYHRAAEERFVDARTEVPEFDALLSAMKVVHDEALHSLTEVIAAFEQEFPGISQKFFATEKPGNFYLRVLKYDNAEVGEFLAKGHYDRGTCTLALAESAPGLRLGINDTNLGEVIHKEHEALFLHGLKFPEVTSESFLPTWHDVIQQSTHSYSPEIARWAVVFFADAHDLPPISYTEAHSPKQ